MIELSFARTNSLNACLDCKAIALNRDIFLHDRGELLSVLAGITHPRVVEQALRIRTLGRIFDEAERQELFELIRPTIVYCRNWAVQYVPYHLMLISCELGWNTFSQLDSENTERPYVNSELIAHCSALHQFWSHPADGTNHGLPSLLPILKLAAEAEVA